MKADRCLTLRDPAGHLFDSGGRLLRVTGADASADVDALLTWLRATEFTHGRVVRSVRLDALRAAELSVRLLQGSHPVGQPATVIEHERIEIVSYPYEWAPAMLHAAAALTLELSERALSIGFGLKDATPYNVLFDGPEPVFVDFLSFERRNTTDRTWLACSQFMRSFLFPLLLSKHFGLTIAQTLGARRDGPEVEEVYRIGRGWRAPMSGGFLSTVTIPMWLGRMIGPNPKWLYQPRLARSAAEATFVLRALFRRLGRLIDRAVPKSRASRWTGYREDCERGFPEYVVAKRAFVQEALASRSCKRVLDVGCNTGDFSRMAAATGASVVAIDADPQVIDEVWKQARARKEPILPLVVDLARPTPATGWLNEECQPFMERLSGKVDCVLMLAVVHHLRVADGIPLAEVIGLAARLTSDIAVIEFVEPSDPMFARLARGREHLYSDYTRDAFERHCATVFEVVRSSPVKDAARWLYLLKKRSD